MTNELTATDIGAMRDWVADCQWGEDADEISELTDSAIVRGIERHYCGGVEQFLLDGGTR